MFILIVFSKCSLRPHLWSVVLQYRQAVAAAPPSPAHSTPSKSFVASGHGLQQSPSNSSVGSHQFLPLQQKQRSFLTFGFGAGGSAGSASRRESHVNVNVTPTGHDLAPDTPEIRKYKKRFNSEILCAALWGYYLAVLSLCLCIIDNNDNKESCYL